MIIAQAMGFIALFLLTASYYRKDTTRILGVQITSSVFFCIHYYLIGAYTALFTHMFVLIIDYLYYKTDLDNKIYFYSVPFYVLIGYFTYTRFIDVLPILSCLVDGFALTKHKRIVLYGALIAYILWLIYDIYYLSLSGVLSDSLIIVSNFYIITHEKDFKKK